MTKKKNKIYPGWREQIKKSELENHSLTVKEFEAKLKTLFEDSLKENTNVASPWSIGYVGNGMYHIGHGAFTGKEGWKIFTETLAEISDLENSDKFLKELGAEPYPNPKDVVYKWKLVNSDGIVEEDNTDKN